MIEQERRLYNRKTLNPLPYINLGPDKGGIVLDVSEQGLRFRATTPTESLAPIRFSFSAHSDLVEGVAELVWTDQVNKTGGLRFTELSDEAREVIRKWPHESDLELSVGQDFMLHMPASDESRSGARGSGVFDAAIQFASSWSKRLRSSLREPSPLEKKAEVAALNSPQIESHSEEPKRSVLVPLSIAIVVVLVSSLSYVGHREVGEWLVRLGTSISGEGQLQTATAQASPSTASMQPAGSGETSGDKSSVDVTPEQVAPQPGNAATLTSPKVSASGPSLPQAPAKNVQLPTRPAANGKELVVQVAALTREADARELADNLRQKNFQAFVRTRPADALYRVMLGPYADTAAARSVVNDLKKAGFSSFVRRQPGPELTGSLRIATP